MLALVVLAVLIERAWPLLFPKGTPTASLRALPSWDQPLRENRRLEFCSPSNLAAKWWLAIPRSFIVGLMSARRSPRLKSGREGRIIWLMCWSRGKRGLREIFAAGPLAGPTIPGPESGG